MSLNDISEWQAIVALRGYLIFTLPAADEGFGSSTLDGDAISSANASEAFEFELTRVFVWPDPLLQIGEAKVADCRTKLVKLMILLDSLVAVCRLGTATERFLEDQGQGLGARDLKFQHIFARTQYRRLWALLEHLEATSLPFNLIKGPLGPAFDMPAVDNLADHLKTVQDVNSLFDSLRLRHNGIVASENSTQGVATAAAGAGDPDGRVREYATAAFKAMFDQLQCCNQAHTAMLYLRSQQNDSLETPTTLLNLFISSLSPDHRAWQEIQCGERDDLRPRQVTNFCDFIRRSETKCPMIHVVGDKIHNITQAGAIARHPDDSPNKSLHSMILHNAFKPLDADNMVSGRFTRTEKRKLVFDIASSLSRLLGSNWVGEGWYAKNLFFLSGTTDHTRSNTPFGPYISCTAGGPSLEDLDRWRPNLDEGESPILLFFAKLLLEIDLGKDLDGRIEDALEEDPDDRLWFLLSEIHDEYRGDLEYSDAIEACIGYHNERRLRHEMGKTTEAPGQWSQWDRGYIQDVAKKLAEPKADKTRQQHQQHQQQEKQQQSRLWMGHYTAHSTAKARPPPASLSFEVASRAMSDQSSDSRLEDQVSMGFGSSLVPSRPSSTNATTVDSQRQSASPSPSPSPTLMPAESRKAKQEAVPQMPQSTRDTSLNVSMWLDGTDQSIIAPEEEPLALRTTLDPARMEEDEACMFFDAEELTVLREHLEEGAKLAETFWDFMRDFNRKHFPPPPDNTQSRRVRVVLIDTGVDVNDPLINPEVESGRIRGRSWVGEETDISDSCGHGTHLVRLVLKVNKSADILIAKVSESKSFSAKSTQNIVEAIQWAVKEDADIISLSLGFKQEVKAIDDALDEAIRPKNKTAEGGPRRPRLVFAAAANWGLNRSLAFPASKKGVICVHATAGNGYDGQLAPQSETSVKNFPIGTLGMTIESTWAGKPVWLKGTSYATPIAAAVAANVLEFGRRNLDAQRLSELEKFRGMRAVLKLMCTHGNNKSFKYCAPWLLYDKTVNEQKIRTTEQIRRAIENEIDELEYD